MDTMMLLAVGAIALSGFVQSVTGFGFGLVSMALLPLLLDYKDAYSIIAIMVLVTCTMTLLSNIRHYRWRQGLGLLIAACIFVPVGFYAMVHIPKEWLLRGLGVLICLYALREILMSRMRPLRIPEKYGPAMGALAAPRAARFTPGGRPPSSMPIRRTGRRSTLSRSCRCPFWRRRSFGSFLSRIRVCSGRSWCASGCSRSSR